MATFVPPEIEDNPIGWGPSKPLTEFVDIPYQPFSKSDKIGLVADWTNSAYQDKRVPNRYVSQFGANYQYAYIHQDDDHSFTLVDSNRTQKTAYQKNRIKFAAAKMKRERDKQQRITASLTGQVQAKSRFNKRHANFRGYRPGRDGRYQTNMRHRQASVVVREDWKHLEDMDFPRLAKLKLPDVPPPEDLYLAGELESYDRAYDRINSKMEKPLEVIERVFHKVTTSDDPIIRKLVTKGDVFVTDAILATLMSCTRSVYSWDIIIQRVGKKLFFDKRDDSEFDLLHVYETANEPPNDEDMNSPSELALEATFINQNFSQQCLKRGEKKSFGHPNPFIAGDESELASVGYRYRLFKLGDGVNLVVRCEHDAVVVSPTGEDLYLNVKTLNEWDPKVSGVDWRQKLDSQSGSVLATEIKNNNFKLAKWTCTALLAGSDYLKLGFVSRSNFSWNRKHVILGTMQFRPKDLATQIAFNVDNAWGVVRCIIDTCMNLPEGKYVLLKDPQKSVLRLYSIPDNMFENEEDLEEVDDGDGIIKEVDEDGDDAGEYGDAW